MEVLIMEEKRMFNVACLEDLKNRLAVKESLEIMYDDAKANGYYTEMYNALVELGEQGLINATDRRLKPAAMEKLSADMGCPLEDIYVDEKAAADFKWMRESRTRYGGNKMTEAEEIAYLENKAAGTAGRPKKDGSATNNGATRKKSSGGADTASSRGDYATERRNMKLTKETTFSVELCEHVGLRKEFGQVGLIKVPSNTLNLRVSEVLNSVLASKILDNSRQETKFAYGLVKDINEFVQSYANRRKTLLEVRKASGTFGIDYLAVVEVVWGKRDGKLAANARVGVNKQALIDAHIEMSEFTRKLTEAVKESLSERNGSECEVRVLLANVKQEDITKNKNIRKRDKAWLSRLHTETGDSLLREILFEEEKANKAKVGR